MAAVFPSSVPTTAQLRILSNNLATLLSTTIDALETSVVLDDASGFPTVGEITIGTEIIHYTGKSTNTLTGCTRGYDSTTAAAHNSGDVVNQYYIADHHNQIAAEVIALGTNLSERIGLDGTYLILPVGIGIIFQPTAGQYRMLNVGADGVVTTQQVTLS
jgi:hypothetical protein